MSHINESLSGPTQLSGDISLIPSIQESPENRARELEAMMMLKVSYYYYVITHDSL